MELLDLIDHVDLTGATTLVVALDGWTDAGRGGTTAAEHLRRFHRSAEAGVFDTDMLYDFRDRRPTIPLDRGMLGDAEWPSLTLYRLDAPAGPLLLLTGAEPDFRWPTILDDLVELADHVGITSYVGLGAVPGPVPHTRPVRVITTASDESLVERYGRPHEQVVVPASCQVMIEAAMRDAGRQTLGLWARIPHYVAGEYPAAAVTLLRRFGDYSGNAYDLGALEEEAAEHAQRLDEAAQSSPEVQAHIEALEGAYDADLADEGGPMQGPLPTGDQIAAELERFLRNQGGS